jgi:hypothetical protein
VASGVTAAVAGALAPVGGPLAAAAGAAAGTAAKTIVTSAIGGARKASARKASGGNADVDETPQARLARLPRMAPRHGLQGVLTPSPAVREHEEGLCCAHADHA